MERCSLTAALPLLSLTLAYAFKGGRSPEGFAIAVLPLAFLPLSPTFRKGWLPAGAGFRPLLVFFAWMLACAVAVPPVYPYLDRLTLLTAYLLFAAAAALWNGRERRAFLGLVLGLGIVEASAFLLLHFRNGVFHGHLFGNPIYSALATGAALMCIPEFTNRRKNALLVPVAILLTVALALTKSRSALLGFIAAAAFIAPRRRYLIGLSLMAVAVLAVGLSDIDRLLGFLKIDPSRPEDLFGRFTIWKSALAASADNPIFGWGLGNFEAAYLQHQFPVDTVLRFNRTTPFAHNDLLQIAVETGWIGAGLAVWTLIAFGRAAKRHYQDSVVRWSTAIVALYAVASLFNFTFFLPFNGFTAAAAFGFVLGRPGGKSRALPWLSHRAWLAVPFVVLLFAALDGAAEAYRNRGNPLTAARVLPIRSDLWYEASMKSLNDPSPDRMSSVRRAGEQLERALRWNPQDAFAWNRLATIGLAVPSLDIDARGAFSRAIELAPSHAPFWIDAGFERLRAKDTAGAEARFRRASELEPFAPLAWFALAAAAKDRGEPEKAAVLLEKAVAVRKEYISAVPPSGYASYLFGMTEEQMKAALK